MFCFIDAVVVFREPPTLTDCNTQLPFSVCTLQMSHSIFFTCTLASPRLVINKSDQKQVCIKLQSDHLSWFNRWTLTASDGCSQLDGHAAALLLGREEQLLLLVIIADGEVLQTEPPLGLRAVDRHQGTVCLGESVRVQRADGDAATQLGSHRAEGAHLQSPLPRRGIVYGMVRGSRQ